MGSAMTPAVYAALSGATKAPTLLPKFSFKTPEADVDDARRVYVSHWATASNLAFTLLRGCFGHRYHSPTLLISYVDLFPTACGHFLRRSEEADANQLSTELQSFYALDEDWDGYGAEAPCQAAIADALDAIELLGGSAATLRPSITSSGEISLFARGANHYLDLGFPGNGTYSFFGIDAQGERHYADDKPLHEIADDAELAEILSTK